MGDDTDARQGKRPFPVWPVTVNGIFHSTINTEPKTVSPQILYPLLSSSKFKKLERLGQAGKLRGWERLESWEAETGWKAGTSAHHSPFTVDVYNHSQLAQQDSTATIGCGNGILLAFGDVDELLAVVDARSRV